MKALVLYEEALDAIRRVFGDTSVSAQETRQSLEGLVSEIEMMIDSLPEGDYE